MRSMVGASWRHGPHHGAQKSTNTGLSLSTTSFCQFSEVSSTIFVLAMKFAFLRKPRRSPVRRPDALLVIIIEVRYNPATRVERSSKPLDAVAKAKIPGQ